MQTIRAENSREAFIECPFGTSGQMRWCGEESGRAWCDVSQQFVLRTAICGVPFPPFGVDRFAIQTAVPDHKIDGVPSLPYVGALAAIGPWLFVAGLCKPWRKSDQRPNIQALAFVRPLRGIPVLSIEPFAIVHPTLRLTDVIIPQPGLAQRIFKWGPSRRSETTFKTVDGNVTVPHVYAYEHTRLPRLSEGADRDPEELVRLGVLTPVTHQPTNLGKALARIWPTMGVLASR